MPDRESIRKWVSDSISKGYSEQQIRQSMYKYGYDSSILDEIVSQKTPAPVTENQHKLQSDQLQRDREMRDRLYQQEFEEKQGLFPKRSSISSRNWLELAKNYSIPIAGLIASGIGSLVLIGSNTVIPSYATVGAGALAALCLVSAKYYKSIAYGGIIFSLMGFLPALSSSFQTSTTFGGVSPISPTTMLISISGPLILLLANALALKRQPILSM